MNNLDNNNENIELTKQKTKLKKSILVLLIVAVIGTIGVTLATGTVNKRSAVNVTTGNYNVIITGNTSVSPSGLRPINNNTDTISPSNLSNYSDSIFISDFTVKGADGNPVDQGIIYDIALIDSNIDGHLLNEYLKWELIKNNTIIANGNFKGLTNGQRYLLTDIQQDLPQYNQTADSLKLVIWINDDFPNDFDQKTMMNKSFSATIDVELYTKSKIGQIHSRDSLYYQITQDAVLDNTSSTYVTASTGIDFTAISSDTNGKGIYIRAGTENDYNPIYYYRGAVDNNNILFANFCWKIVRTTEAGGIKLIYNGAPSNGKCTNTTGDSTQIGKVCFAYTADSPTYAGYMYGEPIIYLRKEMTNISEQYKYGESVNYNNGIYTLSNTKSFAGTTWNTNYNTLGNNHYTCFNTTGVCNNVYYIHKTYTSGAYYITLTNGKKIDDALHEILDYNNTSSNIKTAIDTWYSNNLASYTNNYIEDTIYCNDRSIYQKGGWDPNGNGNFLFGYSGRKANPIVKCPRNIDKFTVSTNVGGNGDLQYPVGLLTVDEVRMSGGAEANNASYYLYTNQAYWLLTPYGLNVLYPNILEVTNAGRILTVPANSQAGVRPVISLKPNIKLKSGDGTANNPYAVK